MGRMEGQGLQDRLLELLPITLLRPGLRSGGGTPAALPCGLRLFGQPPGLGYVRWRDHKPPRLGVPLLGPGPDHVPVQPSHLDLPGDDGTHRGTSVQPEGSRQTITRCPPDGRVLACLSGAFDLLRSGWIDADGRRAGSRPLPCGSPWIVTEAVPSPASPESATRLTSQTTCPASFPAPSPTGGQVPAVPSPSRFPSRPPSPDADSRPAFADPAP